MLARQELRAMNNGHIHKEWGRSSLAMTIVLDIELLVQILLLATA
jgi:hypothetical protein